MLTDSSLTNILIVSGVSQIRYRAYCQQCSRSSLVNYLRNTPEAGDKDIILLKAYKDLIALNIPALWRISSESAEPGNDFVLELWVFWFDERHTGRIDANDDLDALEEIKVGSFTWENAYSKIQSPTSSPVPSSTQSNSSIPVTVSEEYKWFMKAIRNLIQAELKSKGAIPLGEFYIFPNSSQTVIEDNTINSVLCCSYNIYLASTNLIFQPNTRRMRLSPINLQTIQTRGKRVIISPSGEAVQIASNKNYILPAQVEESILRKWSVLLDIPYNYLIQSTSQPQSQTKEQIDLPNLVAVKSPAGGEAFYYPTSLIFVSSSSRLSPTAIAGMNGLFGYNQGFSEDLGDKWNRWAWSERISNFWEYACPRENTASIVLDSLAQDNGSITTNGGLLQRAISEPVIASPLMAAKSVATPGSAAGRKDISTPSSGSLNEEEEQLHQPPPQPNQHYQRHKARYQSEMSLIDFAMSNFAIPNNTEELVEYPIMSMHEQQPQQPQQPQTPFNENQTAVFPSNETPAPSTANYQSPNNLELEEFGIVQNMDVDNMVLDLPNRWDDDGMGDLDNFDFGVTEEDFDFFESSMPATAPPVVMNTAPPPPPIPDTTDFEDIVKPDDFDAMFNDDDQKVLMDKLVLDTDMDHDISVTPLQVGMAQHDPFDYQQQQQQQQTPQQQQQQQTFEQENPFISIQPYDEQQLFVPPDFAPVKINSMVNDKKYTSGGKFTYIPGSTKRKSIDYRPDYVPNLKKNRNRRKSSKAQPSNTNETQTSVAKPETELDSKHDTFDDMSVDQDDSDDESGYTGSSSESSYDSEDDTNKTTRTMNALLLAQDKYISRLIEPGQEHKKVAMLSQVMMDYDSPFARAVASGYIRLPNTKFDHQETEALDYLCQQAVMGGYPFSGGIEAMSSNGFEANEGESSKVIVARRRNLLQKLNGDAIHIPSTPNDIELMTQRFKNALSDIFSQPKRNTEGLDDMILDSLPLPASVTVKGPLNVQQYYDLSETNQAHSKYGKYQVKKRRPAEPNLDTLQAPNITVSRQDDFIEGTSKLIMFWEKLRLKPYSSKKNINYFVIFPKNESIESHVSQFFKGLGTLYETCQLGVHHPGNVGPYRKGLVPVPLLPGRNGESFEERQVRSYSTVCQSLGSEIGGKLQENVHIVIYIINPASHLSSNLDLSRCFTKLMASYHETARSIGVKAMDKSRARVVLQLMPIEHLLRYTSFGGCLKFGLKEIAFSVYSKCHVIASRQHSRIAKQDMHPVTNLYAPPFVLSKPVSDQIQFSLKKAVTTFPTILENHAVLHMGYSFSLDNRWMIIVWTDNCGELIEFAILENKLELTVVFEEAWKRTKKISKRTGFTWTFVIAKMGLLFEEELKAWISFLPAEELIAVVSMDTESTLYVNSFDHRIMNDVSMSTTISSDSLGASTPNMMNASVSNANKKMFTESSSSQTKALLLNHRVAYSNKRERMSYGILGMDSASMEDWMIPLASGYMIHTSPSTENPNSELFNSSPLILEIHLVYNQTNHSAYSTLRDIIKKYHALSYVNVMPSNSNCFPIHLLLVERLSRILLVANP